MNGIALLVALSSLGVDYSWRTTADAEVEYVLQVEPAFIQALIEGEEIHSDVPVEAGKAQRVILRIDTKELPKSAADAQRARALQRTPSRITNEYPTVLWRAGKPPEETAAVTFGWQPDAKGQQSYYLQVDPALLRTLSSGDEIHAIVRAEAGRVATFVVVAGVKQLPRIAGKTAATEPSPPATTGSATAFDNSDRRRFNSMSDSTTAREPGRASTSPANSPTTDPPLYPTRTNESPAARSTAGEPAGPRTRPRWSSSDVPAESTPQSLQPLPEQPATRPGYASTPPAYEPNPRPAYEPNSRDERSLFPAPEPYPNTAGNGPLNDPQGRQEMQVPPFNTARDPGPAGNYPTAPDNRYGPATANGYPNPSAVAPYGANPAGYGYPQPPDDRISSRTPNAPVGVTRPTVQEPYPSVSPNPAGVQTSFAPAATPPVAAPPAAPAATVEAKPTSQPLSVWTLLWCLVFFSVGGNLYLGWTAAEFYSRYKLATERLRSGTTASR